MQKERSLPRKQRSGADSSRLQSLRSVAAPPRLLGIAIVKSTKRNLHTPERSPPSAAPLTDTPSCDPKKKSQRLESVFTGNVNFIFPSPSETTAGSLASHPLHSRTPDTDIGVLLALLQARSSETECYQPFLGQ